MELSFDLNDLTIGDMEDFEEAAGASLTDLLKGGDTVNLSARQLKAFLWIVKRKNEPDFTLDDARNVSVAELNVALEARPTTAAG